MSALVLLPCPFCGARPHHGLGEIQHDQLHGDPYQRYRVWCPTCGGYGFDGANVRVECADSKRAVEKWNRRIPAEQQPDIDAFLGKNRKPVRSLASVMVPSARDLEQQSDSDGQKAVTAPNQCVHGQLGRVCELCEKDTDIANLLRAYVGARDAILNGRGPLESVLDGDQTNAVLAVLDDHFGDVNKMVEQQPDSDARDEVAK